MSWEAKLKEEEWEEGRDIALGDISYRHALFAHCSRRATRIAEFKNGKFPIYTYIKIVNSSGVWSSEGASIMPILPDGRILMIVNFRPVLRLFPDRPRYVHLSGHTYQLGPTDSLEFPAGLIESNEGVVKGAARECIEETGVVAQEVTIWQRGFPLYLFNDIAIRGHFIVLQLSQGDFQDYTTTDGGLRVLALTLEEVERNILSGTAAAALDVWYFYQDILKAQKDPDFMSAIRKSGYLIEKRGRIIL